MSGVAIFQEAHFVQGRLQIAIVPPGNFFTQSIHGLPEAVMDVCLNFLFRSENLNWPVSHEVVSSAINSRHFGDNTKKPPLIGSSPSGFSIKPCSQSQRERAPNLPGGRTAEIAVAFRVFVEGNKLC